MDVRNASLSRSGWSKGFVLKWEDFRPGDIILSRHSKGGDDSTYSVLKSRSIQIATHGEYSHAMLYFQQTIIHAVPPGVFATNPQRQIVAHENDFCVLRYPELSSVECDIIEEFARSRVGSLYHLRLSEIANFISKGLVPVSSVDTKQFCSRLVAQAYMAAKINIVKNPNCCAPGDFLNSDVLHVVEGVTREADDQDLRIINSRDLVKQNFDNTFKWLNAAREFAKGSQIDIQTVNDAISYAVADKDADSVISKAIETSGYLSDWKDERNAHPYRYIQCELLMALKAKMTTFEREIIAESKEAYRHCLELIKFAYICKQSNCKTAKLHLDLHTDIVKDLIVKLNTLAQVTMLSGHINYDVVRLRMLCEQVVGKNGLDSYDEIKKELDGLMHDIQSCSKC